MSYNLILDVLRSIRLDLVEHKMMLIELRERVGVLESAHGSVLQRVDRMDGKLDRIARRLDLGDQP